jgi:chorismate-pyruvate lyase
MNDSNIDNGTFGVLQAEENNGFDPMRDLFIAQSARPAQLREINLRTLTPVQRALLVIDGTVTKFIEAYTMEPVEIVRLGQEKWVLSADHDWLEASKDTRVVARQVLLRGKYSRNLHAYATSLVVPDRLKRTVKQGLDIDGEGLGRLLLNNGIETRREVLWYGLEHADNLPDPIRDLNGHEFISRMYRIIAGGQPIMLINERFPSGDDWLPSHY